MADTRVRRPQRAVALTVSLLVLALIAAGCTGGGGGDDDGGDGPGSGRDRSGRETSLDVRVGRVAGELGTPRRQKVAREVGSVVDRWFEAAYLGGDYPRANFADSWPGFSKDTRRQALRHKRLTSNAGIGRRTSSVEPVRKQVRVDVLAWKGKQRAATARFLLVHDAATGQQTLRHRVRGRLMLVLDGKGRWKVIGYDISRSRTVRGGQS